MQDFYTPYQYVVIEGNIGAGKTTLSRKLADELNWRLILEEFADNPFLPLFYEDPTRHAFSVELFFMTERHKQLQTHLSQGDLFQQGVLGDYFFLKTLLFARNNLTQEEYRLFQRLFTILNATFRKPEMIIYLHRPVEELLQNIHKRGRSYEQEMQGDYLQEIQEAYFGFFKAEKEIPILIVDMAGQDFIGNDTTYNAIKNLFRQEYQPGIHHIQLP